MEYDKDRDGIVSLDGYPWNWEVRVKHRNQSGCVELRKGWSEFLEHVLQKESSAYLVIAYEPGMFFTVRAFYSDYNIITDRPSNKLHLPESIFQHWNGPGPEYLLEVSDSEKAMVIFTFSFSL